MKKEDSKPRIVLLRKWDDGAYYKCSDKNLEAYGSTPKEAFEMWKQISGVKEWKAQRQSGRRPRPRPSAEWIMESLKEGELIPEVL